MHYTSLVKISNISFGICDTDIFYAGVVYLVNFFTANNSSLQPSDRFLDRVCLRTLLTHNFLSVCFGFVITDQCSALPL